MSKNIKKVLVFLFIVATITAFCSFISATTVEETTNAKDGKDTIEEGSIIIGVTKFTPGTVVTGIRAAKAGADDMYVYSSKNGSSANYSYPKMYYYVAGEWFEYDENGKLKSIASIDSLDIYYVNNVLKSGVTIPVKPAGSGGSSGGSSSGGSSSGGGSSSTPTKYTVFFIDGETVTNQEVEKGKTITLPTLIAEEPYVAKWVTEEGEELVPETEITITADTVYVAKRVKESSVDLSGTIESQSNTFTDTYYNKPNTNGGNKEVVTDVEDSKYYVNIGKYVGKDENPTKLTINGREYGTEKASLSIGMNRFIELPVWKISEDGDVLVALTWLCAEALPTTATDVVVSDQTIHVTLYNTEVSENTLTLEDAVKLGTKEGYTHEVTLDKDTNTVTVKRGHGTLGVGIILKYNDTAIIQSSYPNQVIFRLDNENPMSMAIDKTTSNEYTYFKYPFYEDKDLTESITRNFDYKLALPGKGVIAVKIIAIDIPQLEVKVATAEDLQAALKNESTTTITLNNNIDVSSKTTISEGTTKTIDLNGKTIKKSGTTPAFYVLGKLTLKGNGTIESNRIANVNESGELIIEDGNYKNEGAEVLFYAGSVSKFSAVEGGKITVNAGTFNAGEHCFCITNGGELTITGGSFTSRDNAVISGNGTSADKEFINPTTMNISGGTFNGGITTDGYIAMGIYHPQKGTLNVTGGTFNIMKGSGIIMRSGTLNLSNATFSYTNEVENFAGWAGDKKSKIPVGYDVVECTHEGPDGYAYDVNIENVDDTKYKVLEFAE